MTQSIFESFDNVEVEDLGARFMAAIVAVVEFGRADNTDHNVFEPAIARALIASLAAWITHPHQDREQHEEALAAVVARLRIDVGSASA